MRAVLGISTELKIRPDRQSLELSRICGYKPFSRVGLNAIVSDEGDDLRKQFLIEKKWTDEFGNSEA